MIANATKMVLRPYQQDAVDATYDALRDHRDQNPCIVIPTGGGKSLIMAQICRDAVGWGRRVMVLAHVRELLEQTADKLTRICPDVPVGIYSAGLKRRDTEQPVIIGGIQSVYRRPAAFGAINVVLVDEAHMIPPDGEGMYRTFLAAAHELNPRLRVIGLTATPYRTTTGMVCSPDNVLNTVCYEIGVAELIEDGFLCRLTTKAGRAAPDTAGIHIRAGEFIAAELEIAVNTDQLVEAACAEIIDRTADRHSILIFSSGVAHGRHVAEVLRAAGHNVDSVFGDTPSEKRAQVLTGFVDGRLKYLVNCAVLTHGFDAPRTDCVALLRPTLSPGLYYQMVGRGFRLHDGKENCLILDFGGNVMRHGPVNAIAVEAHERADGESPAKKCPECDEIIGAGCTICTACGYEFPPPEPKHDTAASDADIVAEVHRETHEVTGVRYSVHSKKGAPPDHPKTMRVWYQIGRQRSQCEWICLEHDGRSRFGAVDWWRKRSRAPVPRTAAEAVELAEAGALCDTREITVRIASNEKWDKIVGYELGLIRDEPVAMAGAQYDRF